jgi:hypothetical protein
MDAESRKENRASASIVTELYDPDGRDLRGISRLLDISLSGASMDTVTDILENDRVLLRFLMGREHMLVLPAEVVWKRSLSHTYHYGLKFCSSTDTAQAVISRYVEEFHHHHGTATPS